jgi:hypothetical protein
MRPNSGPPVESSRHDAASTFAALHPAKRQGRRKACPGARTAAIERRLVEELRQGSDRAPPLAPVTSATFDARRTLEEGSADTLGRHVHDMGPTAWAGMDGRIVGTMLD